MSIRLRLTLLYSAILALTLIAFSITLYTLQSRETLDALKRDLNGSSIDLGQSILWRMTNPKDPGPPPAQAEPRIPLEILSDSETFHNLREREIVRVLNADGTLAATPPGGNNTALPLSAEGLQTLQNQQVWWETATVNDEPMLIYNRPVMLNGKMVFILQTARSLAERNRTLETLSSMLFTISILTILIAFGVGWAFSGITLTPIHRITQTARAIGNERDFTRRVDYKGPEDEIGQLATTFNSMLSQLQDAYQHVSEALNMQRNFVADVSHELRTPLTTVRGNLALLRRTPPLPPADQADILNDLIEESERLSRLVNDLLVLARADAGRSLKQEPIPMKALVAEVCRQTRQLDRQRDIIEDAENVTVMGDRDALKQVLLILLDNALKHSYGMITVSAEKTIENQVTLRVHDEGPGMSPETLDHVFDRFYRGEERSKKAGFGLGLSIAKALVEGQDGTIEITSRPGEGVTIEIRLNCGTE